LARKTPLTINQKKNPKDRTQKRELNDTRKVALISSTKEHTQKQC